MYPSVNQRILTYVTWHVVRCYIKTSSHSQNNSFVEYNFAGGHGTNISSAERWQDKKEHRSKPQINNKEGSDDDLIGSTQASVGQWTATGIL